jgi:DNA polymerase-3 subunit delta
MFYLLHGTDEYRRSLELDKMKARLGDPSTVDLNTTTLDGRNLSLEELAFACDTVPFLSDKRLVIVNDLAARLEKRTGETPSEPEKDSAFLERLEQYLKALPDSARLVFLERRTIGKGNPIHRLATQTEHGYEREFTPLPPGELSRWIAARAQEKGGKIEPGAIRILATYVGNDLRLLDSEIEKLLTYAGPERAVTERDAQLLVSYAGEADIFAMVDALGTRDTRRAMEMMEKLLAEGQHPLYLLRMITRQFRILLQIKELLNKGTAATDVRGLLHLHPYVAKKTMAQARNFSVPQLEEIYHRLLEIDEAVKTGQLEDHLALNLFVAELGH